VIQYDFGKTTPSGFERTGFLNTPPTILLGAVAKLRANHLTRRSSLSEYLSTLSRLPEFTRDDAGPDVLFEPTYKHVGGATCELCSKDRVVERPPRRNEGVVVHYGTIASGNQVMKDGATRDRVSSDFGGALCFEMEAAGLMNTFPSLIIRGICDYADSHKNKRWQAYAAATAAACTKELLSVIPADSQARIESNISELVHASLQSHHDTQQALLILSQKIDELPSLSTEQFETIRTISGRMQNQVGGLPTWRPSSTTPETQIPLSHALKEGNSVESRLEGSRYSHNRNLSMSIQNLCQLAELKPKTASSEMAQSIIYDLEQLLNAASRAASEADATQGRSGTYEITYLEQLEQEVKLKRDITRTRGLLNASFDVEINRRGQPMTTSIHLPSHPFCSV